MTLSTQTLRSEIGQFSQNAWRDAGRDLRHKGVQHIATRSSLIGHIRPQSLWV
jgi:hypothetical protein